MSIWTKILRQISLIFVFKLQKKINKMRLKAYPTDSRLDINRMYDVFRFRQNFKMYFEVNLFRD